MSYWQVYFATTGLMYAFWVAFWMWRVTKHKVKQHFDMIKWFLISAALSLPIAMGIYYTLKIVGSCRA